MSAFEDIHSPGVVGTLAMFDRLIFRGHLTRLFPPGALRVMLWSQGVPVTGFGTWANKASTALCENAQRVATDTGRPCIYLEQITTRDTGQGKEDMARRIAERDGITEGLVCVLRAVEACMSFKLRRNHDTHQLELVRAKPACVHLYFYYVDPEFGFMHVKLHTWLPFQIQIYLNGREWLARQLDTAGISYLRHDNALLRIDNLRAAYDACERFAHRAWPRVLDAFARAVNPHLPVIRQAGFGSYYWVVDQAEIATDVMFKDRPSLAAIMPDLVHHASLNMSSADTLRFLGRKLHPSLKAEVVTDTKGRPEGWRVKHRLARNWIKVYDKVSVLRVETTINNPREFWILRVLTDGKGRRERRWTEMNKGVANFWRYYQVGLAANRRYLDALAAAPSKAKESPPSTPCAGPEPSTDDTTPASTPSDAPTEPYSRPSSPAGTPSSDSETPTSPPASTPDPPSTPPKPTDDAPGYHDSSQNSEDTDWSPRFPANASIASPPMANKS